MALPQETLDRIIALREKRGWSSERIGRALGLARSRVEYHLLKFGVEAPGPRRPTPKLPAVRWRYGRPVRLFTAEEDAVLLTRREEGITRLAIALGRRASSIRLRLFTLARHEARAEASRERRAA